MPGSPLVKVEVTGVWLLAVEGEGTEVMASGPGPLRTSDGGAALSRA